MKFDSEEDNELFEHLMKENKVYKKLAKFTSSHNEHKRRRKVDKYKKARPVSEKSYGKSQISFAGLRRARISFDIVFKLKDSHLHGKVINSNEE